ncbi:mCG1041380 [Mus musculus]|nr:mCG1041380 [Mus musculus]
MSFYFWLSRQCRRKNSELLWFSRFINPFPIPFPWCIFLKEAKSALSLESILSIPISNTVFLFFFNVHLVFGLHVYLCKGIRSTGT